MISQRNDNASVMNVEITGGSVEDGSARTIFRNDGGVINIEGLTVERVTSDILIATSDSGSAVFSDASVSQSSVESITSTSSGGSQRVAGVRVSQMQSMEDAFLADGPGTNLIVDETSVDSNVLSNTWNIIAVRSGAVGRVTASSFKSNTGIQSGISATSAGSVVTLLDSVVSNNFGLGVGLKVSEVMNAFRNSFPRSPAHSLPLFFLSIVFRQMKRAHRFLPSLVVPYQWNALSLIEMRNSRYVNSPHSCFHHVV